MEEWERETKLSIGDVRKLFAATKLRRNREGIVTQVLQLNMKCAEKQEDS